MAKAKHTETAAGGVVNAEALARFVDRIEILHGARKELNATIREVYEQVRQAGLDAETVHQMVRERSLDPQIRANQYLLRDAYRRALGMLADTPLGEAAMEAAVNGAAQKNAKPRPFAEQTVHPPRRSRKLRLFDAEHPHGTA